ncbi:hypothetical protein REPUB_Repub17cG0041000 [Reevesia pubescens]
MAEILSEMNSVSMENNVLNQNSDECKRLLAGKEIMAGTQGDVNYGHNQDDQALLLQGTGYNNTLLALQEIPGPSTPVKINGDHVVTNEVVEMVKEKPKLMLTNDLKPRLRWTHELHTYFVDAVNHLGGPHILLITLHSRNVLYTRPDACGKFVNLYSVVLLSYTLPFNALCRVLMVLLSFDDCDQRTHLAFVAKATPKAVLDVMDIDGLGLFHVKSHLQKYRLGKFSVKEWQDTTKNVSQVVGGSYCVTSLVLSRTNGYNKGHKAKKTPKPEKEIQGEHYLQIEAEKHIQRCLEAQRRYLGTALDRACKKLADRYFGNAATSENAILYGQASASLGTFTTIPGPSDLGSVTTMPQFYFNQQNAYRTYDAQTTQANLGLQEVPFSCQPQTSLYNAPEGFASTSYGYSASSYQETLPANDGSGKKRVQPADEDLIEAFLNWDDGEPKNLNFWL